MMDAFFDSSDKTFPTFDLDSDRVNLFDLHAQVLRQSGRVRITRDGQACVLMTQSELESLERALEILSDNEAVRGVRDQIAMAAQLVTAAPPQFAPPAIASARLRSDNL